MDGGPPWRGLLGSAPATLGPGPGSAAVAHTVSALTPRLGAQLATQLFPCSPLSPLATCHPPQDFISSAFSQPPLPPLAPESMLLIIPPVSRACILQHRLSFCYFVPYFLNSPGPSSFISSSLVLFAAPPGLLSSADLISVVDGPFSSRPGAVGGGPLAGPVLEVCRDAPWKSLFWLA